MKFNYKEYLQNVVKPKSVNEILNRFIFAFCSVHTTWENNIKGYIMLKDNKITDELLLKDKIKKSPLGMYNVRAKALSKFTKEFNKEPKKFLKRRNETWQDYATRLEKSIYGLGFAKTRFAIELLYPNSAKVCCVDTHIIQWSKQSPKKINRTLYNKIEQGWLNHSKKQKLNPVEARWLWWDKKQGYSDCRYWTKVFEE